MGGFLFCGMNHPLKKYVRLSVVEALIGVKHYILVVVVLLTFHFCALAQKEIITTGTDFIVAKNYKGANRYLDSVLKKEPKNVDALMMKGNVILNWAMDTTAPMQFITDADESPYVSLKEKPKLLSARNVAAIEKFWRRALVIDSTRFDIRKGLCTIYAMALMKDSLKTEIVRLVSAEKDDGEQAFRTCEYARKYKERNRFDEGMEIYAFIAKLFPTVAGVRCDIGSEYYYNGKLNEALAWFDSCYNFKTVDETSFLNGAFTYSLLGYFDDAQSVLNTYSKVYDRKMDRFYYGLRLFSDSMDTYAPVLTEFCNAVDSNAYYNEVTLARRLLQYRDSFSIKDYKALIDDKEIQDYYKVLIHQRAVRQFNDNCEPFLIFGVLQASIQNYSAAVQFLEEGKTCKLGKSQTEYWLLHYGYTLYRLGQTENAAYYFKQLLESDNLFTKHAATYFVGKIKIQTGEVAEGKTMLHLLAAEPKPTKYVTIARQLY